MTDGRLGSTDGAIEYKDAHGHIATIVLRFADIQEHDYVLEVGDVVKFHIKTVRRTKTQSAVDVGLVLEPDTPLKASHVRDRMAHLPHVRALSPPCNPAWHWALSSWRTSVRRSCSHSSTCDVTIVLTKFDKHCSKTGHALRKRLRLGLPVSFQFAHRNGQRVPANMQPGEDYCLQWKVTWHHC